MPYSVPSPSSTISNSTTDTDSFLPTPDQPQISSRLYSPLLQQYTQTTMSQKRSDGAEDGDLFSPSSSSSSKITSPENIIRGPQLNQPYENIIKKGNLMTPSISLDSDPDSPSLSSLHRAGSPTNINAARRKGSNAANRAPPPPPIFLRRPTGLENDRDDAEDEIVPFPGSASTGPGSQPPSAKGLNISGMNMPDISTAAIIEQEMDDSLPDLLGSPRRLNFSNPELAPSSPAWQSFDNPPSAGLGGSSWSRRHSQTLELPSPLGPRNNEKRFEPTPQHGLHARNLSLYFPQPGAPRPPGSAPGSPMFMEGREAIIPGVGAGGEKRTFEGSGNWTFGQAQASGLDGSELQTPEGVKRSKRRGHHHKHSLSHNFFSFLDPTQTNPALAASPSSPLPPASPGPDATPAAVPMPVLGAASSARTASPSLSLLPPSKFDHRGQFLLSFAVLEFLIGAGLWIEGQMSGWRCLAGVGYLVVFDAIGVGVQFLDGGLGGTWSSVRRPYGSSRFSSLLYFAQSLFLVFSAVYIAKESIEQVVLGSGAHEHAVGGHGHGEVVLEGDERPFPHFLLLCATISSLFAGGALQNHSKLVDAVGTLFLPTSYLYLPFVSQFPSLFANPFTMTVTGASVGILVSTLVVPPAALHSLDSLISLILTILTSALSYPPTLAFGHVLLQTAPPQSQNQSVSLRRALNDIKDDGRVLGLGTMRCWAVSAGKGHFETQYSYSQAHTPIGSTVNSPRTERFSVSQGISASPRSSITQLDQSISNSNSYFTTPTTATTSTSSSTSKESWIPLVITLVVHVHPDSSDRDILDVTKMAYLKLSAALVAGSNTAGGGGGGGGKGSEGEVSIQVKRGWEGLEDS